jgi:predicted PurR-regulated permease PerM
MPDLPGRYEWMPDYLTKVGLVTIVVLLSLLLWYAADIFLLFFAGVLLAVALRSLADALARRAPISSGWSLAIVVLIFSALVVMIAWLYGPQIVQGIYDFARGLPSAVRSIERYLLGFGWGQQLLESLANVPWATVGQDILKRLVGIFSTALPAIAGIFVVLFLGLYLSAEPKLYINGFLRLVPIARRQRAADVAHQLGYVLKWFLVGRILSMAVLFVLTWIGLFFLNVPYAFPLALLAGLLEFIPNIGPILSAVPAIIVAFSQSPMLAVWVVVLYLALQTFQSYLVTPLIQREMIAVPPALLFLVQLVMGLLFGILGLLLAAPMTAVLVVLVRALYVEDALGDREVDA